MQLSMCMYKQESMRRCGCVYVQHCTPMTTAMCSVQQANAMACINTGLVAWRRRSHATKLYHRGSLSCRYDMHMRYMCVASDTTQTGSGCACREHRCCASNAAILRTDVWSYSNSSNTILSRLSLTTGEASPNLISLGCTYTQQRGG